MNPEKSRKNLSIMHNDEKRTLSKDQDVKSLHAHGHILYDNVFFDINTVKRINFTEKWIKKDSLYINEIPAFLQWNHR